MTAIFQAVWPIVDETVTLSALIAEASADLERLADQTHAVITGPPVWDIRPAEQVIGWQAYAPGSVLICRAPAENTRLAPQRCHDIDRSEVDAALDRRTLPKRGADRAELLRHLREDQRMSYADIAARTGMSKSAISRALCRIHERQAAKTPERTAA